jgi:hypothetical protein
MLFCLLYGSSCRGFSCRLCLYSYPQATLRKPKNICKRRHGPKTRAWRVAHNQLLISQVSTNTLPGSRKKYFKTKVLWSLNKRESVKKDIFAETLKRLIKFWKLRWNCFQSLESMWYWLGTSPQYYTSFECLTCNMLQRLVFHSQKCMIAYRGTWLFTDPHEQCFLYQSLNDVLYHTLPYTGFSHYIVMQYSHSQYR